jgi:hypothetical protein
VVEANAVLALPESRPTALWGVHENNRGKADPGTDRATDVLDLASPSASSGSSCSCCRRLESVGGRLPLWVSLAGMLATVGKAHPTVSLDDSMSAQRERVLLEAMLRHQVGIDPYAAGAVLDLGAVGMVNSAWRNSPVEDWHAQGRLRDGNMLRINAYSTWRVRQIIRRWRAEVGLTARSRVDALDAIEVDDTDRLAVRIWRWLVNPSRQYPTGTTLAELAGDDLSEYGEHADGTLGGFAATAERHGARYAFWRAAAHGGLACRHWWGTPTWPPLVDRFLYVLDHLDDPHWGTDATLSKRLRAEPAQVSDRAGLRRVLLGQPWSLEPHVAQWIVDAGIGFLRDSLPPLPEVD